MAKKKSENLMKKLERDRVRAENKAKKLARDQLRAEKAE